MKVPTPTNWTPRLIRDAQGWAKQFKYFSTLFAKITDIEGDVVECGVGEGNSFTMLAELLGNEKREPKRRLWGFDSFEGFPEPVPEDASPRNPKKGEWSVPQEAVISKLKESGILENFPNLDFMLTKGFLGETLPNFPERKIAFLHIDVDLYTGYRDALHHLFPKVSPRGVVLFDEYKDLPTEPEYGGGAIDRWPGCTKAVDEYFKDRPEKLEYYPEMRKYYLIKS